MAEQITMPKIAMGQTEAQIAEWLVPPGTWVEKGQAVMVIETEKVSYEIEAPASGYLLPQVPLHEIVPVGAVVALLAESEAELAELRGEGSAVPAGASAQPTTPSTAPAPQATRTARRIKITPVAKRKAALHGVDITRITGSGPNGRIINKDIEAAIAAQAEAAAIPAAPAVPEALPETALDTMTGLRVKAVLPFQGMRKAIAEHMRSSLATSAQVSGACELDMSEIVALRRKLLQKEDEIGVRITYNDIFVLILAKAVRHVPIVNASLVGDEIKIWEDINVAIAVAVERGPYETGLVAPVIRHADRKSLAEIARESRALIQKAHAGQLTPEELAGGTITVSNVGGLAPGWTISTPILNQPQAFILQPGRIVDRPVARDGELVIRPIMPLSFTFDHRIMDGAAPLRLIARIGELVENPEYLHL